jgi:hypothetical protein
MHAYYRNLASFVLLATLMGCGITAAPAQETTEPVHETRLSTGFDCPVSLPGSVRGNDALGVQQPLSDGKIVFSTGGHGGPGFIEPDGSLAMKWMWYRHIPGEFTIEGRRLDSIKARPLDALISIDTANPEGLGAQPTMLIFPSDGCWEVTGRLGDESLTFVMLVETV